MIRNYLSMLFLTLASFIMFQMAGCAGRPLQISNVNNVLTSEENVMKGKKVPTGVFSLQDKISFFVNVKWDDPTQKYGNHPVVYNWYSSDKLISTATRTVNFDSTPTQIWSKREASALGPGHFKAEILIDGKIVAASEFDIKE